MIELYAGATLHLAHKRTVEVFECSNCHHLMVRVDKSKLLEQDFMVISQFKLRYAAEESKHDNCEECIEAHRVAKLKKIQEEKLRIAREKRHQNDPAPQTGAEATPTAPTGDPETPIVTQSPE